MKKRLFLSVVAVAAIAVGYQKYTQAQTMSDLMLANVEALASGETGISCVDFGCTFDYRYICEVYINGSLHKACFYYRPR